MWEITEFWFTDAVLTFGEEPDGTLFFQWSDREDEPFMPPRKSVTQRQIVELLITKAKFAKLLRMMGIPPDDVEGHYDLMQFS